MNKLLLPLILVSGISYSQCYEKVPNKIKRIIKRQSVVKDKEFIDLVFALISVESSFRTEAWSSKGALGLMQILPANIESAIQMCGLPYRGYNLAEPNDNILIGTCLLADWIHENNGNLVRALITYNGGYRQLNKFLNKGQVVQETLNYTIKVLDKKHQCSEKKGG